MFRICCPPRAQSCEFTPYGFGADAGVPVVLRTALVSNKSVVPSVYITYACTLHPSTGQSFALRYTVTKLFEVVTWLLYSLNVSGISSSNVLHEQSSPNANVEYVAEPSVQ